MRARAYWVTGPRQGTWREEQLRAPQAGEVRVRALFSGISRGTERLVHEGRVPAAHAAQMRAPFQQGDFPWPVKYGYSSVGVVEAGDLPAGSVVFCLFPHQDRFIAPTAACTVVPATVPPRRAVLAANLETAINAVWDAGVGPGDRVAVVGAGVVGSLVAWLCGRVPGTTVTLVDVVSERAQLADALGVRFASPAQAPTEQDLVVHASASPAGLATALSLAGDEALVLELSWYGEGLVPAPLGGAFHHRRLTLRSSQVGRLPPRRLPRWDYARRRALAVALLAEPVLDALLEPTTSMEALPALQARLCAPGPHLCHVISYGG